MWIFGRHRHLSAELLSEYLDERLSGAQQARVAQQVESCTSCRDELENLRATVSLLQALPELPMRRTFTLAAPPPEPITLRQPVAFRAPNWVYAGAASVAGLALAVLISADTVGLLTTPAPVDRTISSQATTEKVIAPTILPGPGRR